MTLFRTRFGLKAMLGLVGLCALLFWAMKRSRDSHPSRLYSGWLVEGDDAQRSQAAQELGNPGDEPEVAATALIHAMLNDRNASVRQRSARSLAELAVRLENGRIKELATHSFVQSIKDKDASVRRSAADALGRLTPLPGSVLPALLLAARDENEWVRGSAIAAVGLVEKKAKLNQDSPRRAIIRALDDPSLHVREMGIYAFWAVAETSPEIAIDLLKEDDSHVRLAAIAALSRNTPLAVQVIPELTTSLADPVPAIRARAATLLGNVGPIPKPTISALETARTDPDPEVRSAAAEALANQR
jgi:HEAT repeat protein